MDQKDLMGCVDVFKAIAHPLRLKVIEELQKGERCACEIAALFPESDRTTVSKHLGVMVDKGVLLQERRGVNIYYRLRLGCLPATLACVKNALQGERGCACRGIADKKADAE